MRSHNKADHSVLDRKRYPHQQGQGLAEYALLLALTSVVLIAGLSAVGPAIGEQYRNIITAFGINTTLQENTFEPPPAGGGGGAVPTTTPPGAAPLDVYVLDSDSAPLNGVTVAVLQGGHPYHGITGATDASGIARFNLDPGTYTFIAQYHGQSYPSPSSSTLPGSTFSIIQISQQSVTVKVADSSGHPLSGVKVTLHNAAGAYLNLSAITDGNGKVVMAVPCEAIKFKALVGGNNFWSGEINPQTSLNAKIVVPNQDYTITVLKKNKKPLNGATVMVLNPDGSQTGITGKTDDNGEVTLSLRPGSYKFDVIKVRKNNDDLRATTGVLDFPASDPLTIRMD